jgi:hypothetical protein
MGSESRTETIAIDGIEFELTHTDGFWETRWVTAITRDQAIKQTLRIAVEAEIAETTEGMSVDELRGILALVRKLEAGSRKHGRMNLASESRDFAAEQREELQDALWYSIWHELTQRPAP